MKLCIVVLSISMHYIFVLLFVSVLLKLKKCAFYLIRKNYVQ